MFDLFAALDATDEQLDFLIFYGSGLRRLDGRQPRRPQGPGARAAVRNGAEACSGADRPSRAVPNDRHDPRGQSVPRPVITGRIESGSVKPNQVKVLHHDGTLMETAASRNSRLPRAGAPADRRRAVAGDIVAIAGLSKGTVADTFCDVRL